MKHDFVPIKIFIVTGHNILLWGLQQLVSANEPATRFVGSATSTANLIPAVIAAAPDVILLDLDIAESTPIDILAIARCSSAKLLVMTQQQNDAMTDQAVLEGARGVLGRHASPASLIEAVSKVHDGQVWLDRAATGRIMVELSRRQNNPVEQKTSHISTLTNREKKILTSILENSGAPAKTIAQKLHISESTLRNHLTSVYDKLGVSNRFELISFAHKNNLGQSLFSTTA